MIGGGGGQGQRVEIYIPIHIQKIGNLKTFIN
jgi:hypothetical protein